MIAYCSSVLYLTSRVSQIYKNMKRRSAEGLALTMFLCAMAANTLYGLSIVVRAYSLADITSSAPWLIGSLGTVALDTTIFMQARPACCCLLARMQVLYWQPGCGGVGSCAGRGAVGRAPYKPAKRKWLSSSRFDFSSAGPGVWHTQEARERRGGAAVGRGKQVLGLQLRPPRGGKILFGAAAGCRCTGLYASRRGQEHRDHELRPCVLAVYASVGPPPFFRQLLVSLSFLVSQPSVAAWSLCT